MKKYIPIYIEPDAGQGVLALAKEIYKMKEDNKENGYKVFLILPEKTIEVSGENVEDIRDSIATQCKYTTF